MLETKCPSEETCPSCLKHKIRPLENTEHIVARKDHTNRSFPANWSTISY